MTNRNDGGPAFPCDPKLFRTDGTTIEPVTQEGMSLRDWFAGQALAGVMAGPNSMKILIDMVGGPEAALTEKGSVGRFLASCCYEYADAMLVERQK